MDEKKSTEAQGGHAIIQEGFHYKHGWFFKRLEDGSVRITKLGSPGDNTVASETIDPDGWASIVSSVSKSGETGLRWEKARLFHSE